MKRSLFVVMLSLVLAMLLTACAPADYSGSTPELDFAPAPVPVPAESPASEDFEIADAPADDWFFDASDVELDFSLPAMESAPPVIHVAPPSDSMGRPVMLPFITPSSASNRQMVYTVDVQLQTTDFMDGIGLLVSTVTEFGGFVESAHVQGRDMRTPDVERVANYVFRIHSDNLARFISVMESNFNLLSMAQWANDVTESHVQGTFAIDDLREREAEILSEKNEISETLNDSEVLAQLYEEDIALLQSRLSALESELREIRVGIRDLERRQIVLDDTINYSTVIVTLVEAVYIIETPLGFGERMGDATASGFEDLLRALQGLLIFVVRALPVLIILAIIGVPAFLITRKILQKTETRRTLKKLALEKARNDAVAQYYGQQT